MTHDFAKIKPEPLLERKTVATPPAWSLMFTGMIVGLALGVFGCFLFYLSGNVPALNINSPAQSNALPNSNLPATAQLSNEPEEEELRLEFYTELPNYEVPVDASPVELTAGQTETLGQGTELSNTLSSQASELEQFYDPGFILQTGAFQELERANSESDRQKILGLEVKVKQQQLLGRTLYLVQSGPYTSSSILSQAEQLLQANNIPSLRMSIQSRQ